MKTVTAPTFPEGVTVKDTEYPKWDSKDKAVRELGDYGQITMHLTTAFGWCVATLPISKARRAGLTDRTYGVRVSDGAGVRVGAGPHVTKTITVYLRKSRVKVLQKYIDLFQKGLIQANETRDRISSRRAEGVQRRAEGAFSWRWSV